MAFRRDRPNEVLYECDVDNFYLIVFYWSENSLFDFDGRVFVDQIYCKNNSRDELLQL